MPSGMSSRGSRNLGSTTAAEISSRRASRANSRALLDIGTRSQQGKKSRRIRRFDDRSELGGPAARAQPRPRRVARRRARVRTGQATGAARVHHFIGGLDATDHLVSSVARPGCKRGRWIGQRPDPDRLIPRVIPAVHDVPFGIGGGHRDAVGGLCDDRWRHPPVVARLQLLGRGLGRL